jgi:hypothetical protein
MDKAVATPREITPYTKEQILRLEDALFKLPNQLDFEQYTEHFFAPGIYVRQLTIPAGTVLTGKIHRYEIMNILVSGTIKVTTDDGVEEVSGPLIFNSKAGSKKAGFALTDVVWLNVHPTELTDLEEIERHFIAPSFEALEQEQRKQIGPSVDEQEDEQSWWKVIYGKRNLKIRRGNASKSNLMSCSSLRPMTSAERFPARSGSSCGPSRRSHCPASSRPGAVRRSGCTRTRPSR